MQMPTLLNDDSTRFFLSPLEIPTLREQAYCGVFIDFLLDRRHGCSSAHFWLDRSDPELEVALRRIYERLFTVRKSDVCLKLKKLFGSPSKPPTAAEVRRFLRALVSLPESYWCRRNERREAEQRDVDEAKNGAPTDVDKVELAQTETSDNGCSEERSTAAFETGFPAGDNNWPHEQDPSRLRRIAIDINRRAVRSKRQCRRIPLIPKEPQARAAFIRRIAEGVSRNGRKFPTPHSPDWPEFEQALTRAFGSIHLDVDDGLAKIVP
ncbi:hypothetical protein H8A97_03520 [Bradyrhizobium sp. Arg62]|uniref:hypothetical protein n=1 Tax=Bradyrhizobium brasilense TaxID=1419277 RepID=UPI001E55B733|nr:hypothetical protein [Bradyrhizobium brasilense]MCC8944192.1 hypothetical protein [Bradyrhizobium brasilense]